ncbi:MAG: fumarylacetoacetate hydrolase family protein [Alphaproteobacteria bacterium]
MNLTPEAILPVDAAAACLVGRVWRPAPIDGPAVVVLAPTGQLVDISSRFPTISHLLEAQNPAAAARDALEDGEAVGTLAEALAGITAGAGLRLLAPCDLQALKAAGVTFVKSMLERVIEERAAGDAAAAESIRQTIGAEIGGNLADIVPGSERAMKLKQSLIRQGLWSQYLEVGIGPDAEVFTKAPPMAAVGVGADVGIHPKSAWNNPEPEIVMAVNSRGETVGATLGNDVNLRDFEGRSALLLGKAKDNNASCALGPFIRLFDQGFGIGDVRQAVVSLRVEGRDGFVLEGSSSLSEISRDPLDLVGQTIGETHQYPDGFLLFTGTMFAPVEDRDTPGQGFTHKIGDVVTIASEKLGALVNRVDHADRIAPWTFGTRALMENLAQRGLLG